MYTLCLSRISYRFTIRFSVQKRCRALHLGYQYTQFSKFVKSGGREGKRAPIGALFCAFCKYVRKGEKLSMRV
mgnify:CR=1 FL=1